MCCLYTCDMSHVLSIFSMLQPKGRHYFMMRIVCEKLHYKLLWRLSLMITGFWGTSKYIAHTTKDSRMYSISNDYLNIFRICEPCYTNLVSLNTCLHVHFKISWDVNFVIRVSLTMNWLLWRCNFLVQLLWSSFFGKAKINFKNICWKQFQWTLSIL